MMIIDNASVFMSARHEKTEISQREERLQVWVGQKPPGEAPEKPALPTLVEDLPELSEEAMQRLEESALGQTVGVGDPEELGLSDHDRQQLTVLQAMLEKLTGKKFDF